VLDDSAGGGDLPPATGPAGGPDGGAAGGAFVLKSFDPNAQKVVQASRSGTKLKLTLDGVLFDFDHDNPGRLISSWHQCAGLVPTSTSSSSSRAIKRLFSITVAWTAAVGASSRTMSCSVVDSAP
jgi:hypothetical protein